LSRNQSSEDESQDQPVRQIASYSPGFDALFPDHPLEDKPKEKTIEAQVNGLVVKALLLEHEDNAKALELIEEAVKLAQDNGLPYTHIEAERLGFTQGDRSKLVPSYQRDLAYHVQRGELWKAFMVLSWLADEYNRLGNKQQVLFFLDQATNTLNALIHSDKPIAQHPDFEGYDFSALRICLAR
jgi:tetratricopeptide (TPR) repeat protein